MDEELIGQVDAEHRDDGKRINPIQTIGRKNRKLPEMLPVQPSRMAAVRLNLVGE